MSDAAAPDLLATLGGDGLIFGCDYNPEQWDRETWLDDVRLMREVGVGLAAINVFGWSEINPAHGVWDFAALDEIIALLHENGIRVNLGTGTASPPPWLSARHPEILPVAEDGTRSYPGGRQAYCPSSPVFRAYAAELTTRVAERYGAHPAVALWHVSNELGCHNALCYCDASAEAFRGWLRARYDSVDALNRAWGTAFWSQRYGAWEEIFPPRRALSLRNPAQMLDFQRFSSDEELGLYRAEAAIIRGRSVAPVTTNFMVTAHIRNLDYWSWAAEMDVIANDHYLDRRLDDPRAELAFSADLTRGLAGGGPWILMETSTGAVNWQPQNLAKAPGELLRNITAYVARGADGICFFQWRASVQGAEKYHSALLPHAGTDTAAWADVQRLGALLGRLGGLHGTRVTAQSAILFDWNSWWALEGEGRPSDQLAYLDQVHAAHAALSAHGLTADVVHPSTDLSGYRLVIVPALHLVSDADAAALRAFAEAGGTVLVTFSSGIVDETDRVRLGGYPGAFRDLVGVFGEEFAPLAAGRSVALLNGATGSIWTERLRAHDDTEVIATYLDGPAAGGPALTRRRAGDGTAWYAATLLDPSGYADLIGRIAAEAGLTGFAGAGPDVEIVRRAGQGRSYLFAINHGHAEAFVEARGRDLVSGEAATGRLPIAAGGVRIIEEIS
ncbi:beta-galactosidase [Microbacterium sp. cx-59]|uniref:beta-galactosidase n=1 Tax=Microbacterium sp. cx-59 TaxID=2891207 RepID=UPI001E6258D1|nr:beta-galactosidase [Microbacterium sp. cx-59]MCC4909265.1 beta-galactosidase [Microbacterium sp. cx-59]